MSKENDLLLWNSIKKGDAKSFDVLFSKYFNYLYNYGLSLTQDEALIKDVIQDLFYDLWKDRKKLNINRSVKYYLLQSFRRMVFLKFKENKLVPLEEYHKDVNITESIQAKIIHKENRSMHSLNLQIMAKSLTGRQREAIFLKYYKGMDSQEISDLMQIDIKAVYKLISTGIIRYRNLLKKMN